MGQAESLTKLTAQITETVNESLRSGRCDRSDAISALHIVLARITRETEEMSTRRPPDIRADNSDNRR